MRRPRAYGREELQQQRRSNTVAPTPDTQRRRSRASSRQAPPARGPAAATPDAWWRSHKACLSSRSTVTPRSARSQQRRRAVELAHFIVPTVRSPTAVPPSGAHAAGSARAWAARRANVVCDPRCFNAVLACAHASATLQAQAGMGERYSASGSSAQSTCSASRANTCRPA